MQTRPPGWRAWVGLSSAARRLSTGVVVLAAIGAAGASAVSLLALVRQRPTPHLLGLLVAGAVSLAIGQVWSITVINARRPPRRRGRWPRAGRTLTGYRAVGRFFGNVAPTVFVPIMALALLGWLSAMTAIPALVDGGPALSGGGCRFRLESHGTYRCVTRAVFEHAGAGEQRFTAGVLLGFFCFHAVAALSHLGSRPGDGDRPGEQRDRRFS